MMKMMTKRKVAVIITLRTLAVMMMMVVMMMMTTTTTMTTTTMTVMTEVIRQLPSSCCFHFHFPRIGNSFSNSNPLHACGSCDGYVW